MVDQFVKKGGGYLGLCAGAYFAASHIEFEKGSPLGKINLGVASGQQSKLGRSYLRMLVD